MEDELKKLAHYQLLDSPYLMMDARTRSRYLAPIDTAISVEKRNGKRLWLEPYMRWSTQN